MTVFRAWWDGIRRVAGAPAVLFGLLLVTLLVALPLGAVLNGMIRDHLGQSLEATSAASGVNLEWWQEFSAQATGVGAAFTPGILGFGGVLDNLGGALDNAARPLVVVGAGIAYLLAWLFLVGGVIDRYARNRAVRTAAFFATCGVFFFRFLRLAVSALLVYGVLFGVVHGWLFDRFHPWVTADFAVERSAFLVRLGLYVVFGALVLPFNLVFDYAKVRAVVEDRHSMIGALVASVRFVGRHPGATLGLYLLDALLFVAVVALYAFVAPGAGATGWSMWMGLLVSELYLLLRLAVKLVFYASEVSLFQASLAHAGYTAAPVPVWPDSPAAEAIRGEQG
jgi:hypothetical protein